MKVIHSSDWHLGRSLYQRKRYEEFELFLAWLLETLINEQADVLIVAGDIFDTGTPSNRAQELYYRFLRDVSKTPCRHVVLVAGNHDSPSFLDAPKTVLKALDVHVIGTARDNPADEVVVLYGQSGHPEVIICAVPYLRDRDIRTVEAGESLEEKNRRMIDGVKSHYDAVCATAVAMKTAFENEGSGSVPIIGTGHLFAAGGQTVDGDGVRELYVGSLAHVGCDLFPPSMEYLALGHLHVPQIVGGKDHIRYSGSPIPMGFGEAHQQKLLCAISFESGNRTIREIAIPLFQRLERISGDLEKITETLTNLVAKGESIWVEIEYRGTEVVPHLRELVDGIVENSSVEVLRLGNRRTYDRGLTKSKDDTNLEDLEPMDVFLRCCGELKIEQAQQDELKTVYAELLRSVMEQDLMAQ